MDHNKYRRDIDGLRAIAVLAVVLFHAFPMWFAGGFTGVDIFFVISGYLISNIIVLNIDKGTFSFFDFYGRRIKRIFPALLLVLFACYIVGWIFLLADDFKQLGKHVAGGTSFISNFILWNESGYFDNDAETKPLLHLWSLGIEEQFYILWPLILWASLRWRQKAYVIAIGLFIVSFALNVIGIQYDSVATFYSPQTRFWELLSGSLLALMVVRRSSISLKAYNFVSKLHCENKFLRLRGLSRDGIVNTLSFLGLFLIVFGFVTINKNLNFPGVWAIVPVLGAVLIISAGSDAWINRNILSNRVAVWFGLISFPLYLWHWPLLSFARIVEGDVPARSVRILAVLLSIVLAWLTYLIVERPIRFGARSEKKIKFLLFLCGLFGFIGFETYAHEGLRFRSAAKNTGQFRADQKTSAALLRSDEIRSGICHFNKQGKYKKIESFIDNWSCFSDDEGLFNSRVLVFGDSHSADKVMGLRQLGIDVMQLGGASCPLIPELASDQIDYCKYLFDIIKRNESKFDSIIISNYFPLHLITSNYINKILKYWEGGKNVYLFTPMPDFSSQVSDYLRKGWISSVPDFAKEDAFLKIVDGIDIPKNITIIKSSDLWCSNRSIDESHPCSLLNNNELYMIDGGHLSFPGSKVFARNILSHPMLGHLFK